MGSGEALAHTSPTQSSLSSGLLYFFSLPNSPVRERGQARFLSQSRCEVWDCSSHDWAISSCTKAQPCGGLDVTAHSEFKMAGRYSCSAHLPCYTGWPKPAESFNLGSLWWLSTHCACLLVWLS